MLASGLFLCLYLTIYCVSLFSNYLQYLIKGKTKFYIHSPFVFNFINTVLHDKRQFYFFSQIEKIRRKLLQNNTNITYIDLGAGTKPLTYNAERKISNIAKTATIPEKYGQLLSHLTDYFQPNTVIELGTCLGIGTAYIAAANSKAKVITLEGSEPLANLAQQNFDHLHFKNIEIIKGDFSQTLPIALNKLSIIDMAFIDGNHLYTPTMHYFNQLLPHINANSILIFDDIHWSPEMHRAWREICTHPKVTVTIDLFRLGIVFFRTEQAKENFVLYF